MENISNEINKNQSNHFWQAEVLGQIYDTNFEEMTQWISEGALMATDKVRRNNLRWLEAGKVPTLLPFFNAREQGIEPPQVQTNNTDANVPPNENSAEMENFPPLNEQPNPENNFHTRHQPVQFTETNFPIEQPLENLCVLHPESEAKFHCETCANAFCPQCVKSYGGTVKICPMCGALCKKIGEYDAKKENDIQYWKAIGEGFGAKDFVKAFSHPFKYKSSFIFGGIMFMFFTLGQSAGGIGGITMLFASLVCFLLANMLAFGVLANTVENFSQGKTATDFMPKFDDFNLWDDVIHPFFLSIGVYISSFGVFILVSIFVIYSLFNSMQEQMKNKMQIEKIQAASPLLIDEQKVFNQSEEVKKLTGGIKEDADEKRELSETVLNDKVVAPKNSEEADFEELNQMIQENRKQELESIVGKTEETQREEFNQMISGFMNQSLPLLALTGLAFLWGLFYFPAACAVAGYTRSFTAAINPSVGLDTIYHFGIDYLKILGIFIALLAAFVVVTTILNIIFLPFALPGMGNLPAIAVSSWFTFYFTIVFSCLLGFALFKNSFKFKFYRG